MYTVNIKIKLKTKLILKFLLKIVCYLKIFAYEKKCSFFLCATRKMSFYRLHLLKIYVHIKKNLEMYLCAIHIRKNQKRSNTHMFVGI